MLGVFLIHGFLGKANDFYEFEQILRNNGYLTYAPNLKGHSDDGVIPPFSFWIDEIWNYFVEFESHVTGVFLVGFSMGGILASYIAKTFKSYKIKGIIFINAAFKHIYYNNLGSISKTLNEAIIGFERCKKNSFFKRKIYSATKQLYMLSNKARKEEWLKKFNKSALIIQTLNDGFVLEDTPKYIYNSLLTSNKTISWYLGTHSFFKSPQKAQM